MTKVRTYRIDIDENAQQWDAIVIGSNGWMTSQHLGTAASLDAWTCAGNVPILDINWKLPDNTSPSSTMKKCIYDPDNKQADVYDYRNFDNTPEIPVVNDPTVTFTQGWVAVWSISLNQSWPTTIWLMAGWITAGSAIDINNNEVSVDYDDTSIGVNSCDKLEVKDYATIVSWAAAWATAVQADDLATVAMTGNYCDLINKPEIPSAQIQSDWEQTNTNLPDYIKNKPTIGNATITLQKNGTNVDCFELNQTADKCVNLILSKSDVGLTNVDNTSDADKPVSDATLCALACKQDNITDLNTIRSNACAGKTASETIANYWDIVTHDSCEYATATQGWKADSAVQPGDLCTVATTGSYNDLTGKPTIGSATITIQKNGTCVDTFNTNATTAKCINITMDKTDVGLANVDNTSDINKPVSTAAQAALDCKQDVISDLATIRSNACAWADASTTIASYWDIVTRNTCEFASCAQWAKADTAVQPSQLCTVATTGKYCDLTWTPLLCAVATSAKYCDLLWAPSLCTVATSGKYCDLSWTPALCTVATSWKYCDLSWLPTIPTDNCELSNSCGYTTCIGTVVASDLEPYAKSCDLKTVATSGKYCDLTGTPTIPTDNCQLSNGCGYTTCTWTLVASDLNPYAKSCDLKTVATTWKYCDLTGKPTIPTDNCQLANSCWYITNAVNNLTNYYLKCETYQKCEVDNLIANFGWFEVVATLPSTNIKTNVIYLLWPIWTGSDKYEEWIYYNNTWTKIWETTTDLSNYAKCCDIPTNNNQLTNGCGYTTCTGTLVASDLNPYAKSCTLCTVATSGKYCDLTGKPTIPTDNCQLANSCGYTTCTGTLVANDIANLAQCCDIPTDNCQLANGCWYTTCTWTLVASDLNPYAKSCTLCTVATSGKYCDLTGKPTIPTNNNQLTNGCWYTTCTWTLVASDLQPYAKSCDLKAVATSWAYCDLTGTPTIPTDNCQLANGCGYTTCTWTLVAWDLTPYAKACTLCTVATSGKYCDLTGKPSLATVATSGKYCDLTWTPDLSWYALSCNMVCSLDWADNDHYPTTLAVANALGSAGYWDMLKATYDPCNCEKDVVNYCNMYNKPTLCAVATSGKYCDLSWAPSLATVATSWCYNDLTGKPSLCTIATSGKYCDLSGTPNLATVATTGCYNDLTGKPTIPTKVSQLSNDCNYIDKDVTNLSCYTPTCSLATVATSGAYCDLSGAPSLACVACSWCYDDLTGKPNLWVYQRTCNMVCTLTGADDSHYPTAKTVADALSACGAGDMLKATYDPCNKNANAFDYTNFINTPSLCTVATSGKYCDLTWTPTIPAALSAGNGISITSNCINVNYDWTTIKKNTWNCIYVDFPSQVSDDVFSSSWNSVTSIAPSKNAVYDKVASMDTAIAWKLDWFTISFAWNWSWWVHPVRFVRVDYSTANSENWIFIKMSLVNSHWNWQAWKFLEDAILNVTYTWVVEWTIYRYFGTQTNVSWDYYYNSYWDIFWTIDTTNKIVDFFVLMHQFSYTRMSPYFRLNTSSWWVITQASSWANNPEYSSWTKSRATIYDYSKIPNKTSQLTNDSGFITKSVNNLDNYTLSSALATVATSGKYCDLTGTPDLSCKQDTLVLGTNLHYDWDGKLQVWDANNDLQWMRYVCTSYLKTSSWALNATPTAVAVLDANWWICKQTPSCFINKMWFKTVATSWCYCDLTWAPTLCTVATSGKYCDLTWTPTIPTDNCQLANSCGYTTCTGTLTDSSLKTVNGCCLIGSWDICIQWWVTSVNWCTWAVNVCEVPSWWSTWQVLQKTSSWCWWATISLNAWDMCYSDFNWSSKSWATVTLSLNSTITPSANFTVNKPSTIKEWQTYVLRVTNWSTAYTMTLGTGISNPWWVNLTLTPSGIDQFVFLATSSSTLELQNDTDDEIRFVTQDEYNALPSTKITDGRTYFIVEEE